VLSGCRDAVVQFTMESAVGVGQVRDVNDAFTRADAVIRLTTASRACDVVSWFSTTAFARSNHTVTHQNAIWHSILRYDRLKARFLIHPNSRKCSFSFMLFGECLRIFANPTSPNRYSTVFLRCQHFNYWLTVFTCRRAGSEYSVHKSNQRIDRGTEAWGSERLRCLMHGEDLKRRRGRKESAVTWMERRSLQGDVIARRSIASVSGQTPRCGDVCLWSTIIGIRCHPPG